jgi:hypothetical protein
MSEYNQQSQSLYGYRYDPPPLTPVKDPQDIQPYLFDFSNQMAPYGDQVDTIVEIVAVTVSPSGNAGDLFEVSSLIVQGEDPKFNPPLSAAAVQVVAASGNVLLEPYTLSVLVDTALGYAYKRSLLIPVNER